MALLLLGYHRGPRGPSPPRGHFRTSPPPHLLRLEKSRIMQQPPASPQIAAVTSDISSAINAFLDRETLVDLDLPEPHLETPEAKSASIKTNIAFLANCANKYRRREVIEQRWVLSLRAAITVMVCGQILSEWLFTVLGSGDSPAKTYVSVVLSILNLLALQLSARRGVRQRLLHRLYVEAGCFHRRANTKFAQYLEDGKISDAEFEDMQRDMDAFKTRCAQMERGKSGDEGEVVQE